MAGLLETQGRARRGRDAGECETVAVVTRGVADMVALAEPVDLLVRVRRAALKGDCADGVGRLGRQAGLDW